MTFALLSLWYSGGQCLDIELELGKPRVAALVRLEGSLEAGCLSLGLNRNPVGSLHSGYQNSLIVDV